MPRSLMNRLGACVPAQSAFVLVALSLTLAIPAGVIVRTFEPSLVLPAFSVLLFVSAALAVLVAVLLKAVRDRRGLTLWDIAGGLAITGCAASVLSEPDQVAQLFEHLFERRAPMKQE